MWIFFILALACVSAPSDPESDPTDSNETDSDPADTEDTPIDVSSCAVDVHQHFASNVAFSQAAEELIAKMEAVHVGSGTGVAFTLIQPPPAAGDSDAGAHYDYLSNMSPSLLQVVEDHPLEFGLVAGGGILNSWIHEAVLDERTINDTERANFKAAAGGIIDDGVLAFGEMAVLHISLEGNHPFIASPADHPLYLALAEVSVERSVPIDIHLEAVDQEALAVPDEMPSNCFQNVENGGNNPVSLANSIDAFEILLDHQFDAAADPEDAAIVWSHVGWDNTGDLTAELLDRLFAAHPNLYASLKILDAPGPCQSMENRPLTEDGDLRPEWLALFEEWPERFVLGSDEFVGGTDGVGAPSTQGTWDLMAQLPDELAQAFACDNPRRIYGIDE